MNCEGNLNVILDEKAESQALCPKESACDTDYNCEMTKQSFFKKLS